MSEENLENIVPPEQILFGQFLIDKKKITFDILQNALKLQQEGQINEEYKLLGQTLLQDFKVFKDENELEELLDEFYSYKKTMEKMYDDLIN